MALHLVLVVFVLHFHPVVCKGIPPKDIEYFGRILLQLCEEDCHHFVSIGCCNEACWSSHDCWPKCWNSLCQHEPCCGPPGQRALGRMQQGYRVLATIKVPISPPLCRLGEGDASLPPLPKVSVDAASSVPFARGDLAVVVITQGRAFKRNGQIHLASESWASRVPRASVFFALEDANLTPSRIRWASAHSSVMKIGCPSYWHLDCNSYNTAMYTGPLALQRVLQQRPDTKWFVLMDDDTFIDPTVLAERVYSLPLDEPLCVGRMITQTFHDGASDAPDLFLPNVLQRNFSWLSLGSGIVCNNRAMRAIYRHLEVGPVETALKWFGPVYSDVVITKCLQDLGVRLLNLKYFFFDDLPLQAKMIRELVAGKRKRPVSFHKVVTRQHFEVLNLLNTAGAQVLYQLQ